MTPDSKRARYFARTAVHARRDGKVVLVDMHDASVTQPLDEWLGKVFLLADGSHTVQQLIDFVGRQYPGGAPPTLASTIDSVIDRLARGKIIDFSDAPVALPYYLHLPADQQDPGRARELMLADGFQQCDPIQAVTAAS